MLGFFIMEGLLSPESIFLFNLDCPKIQLAKCSQILEAFRGDEGEKLGEIVAMDEVAISSGPTMLI